MNTTEIARPLAALFVELVDGAAADDAYVLNRNDVGLLRSLDKLDAAAASRLTATGSSIASHVDHVRYGLSLFNRWAAGENPWADADWAASWRKTSVSPSEWRRLLDDLRGETRGWARVLAAPREVDDVELTGVIASVVHTGYHLGAIRQMAPAARGPDA
jgi:hypothetical protein